MFTVEQYAIYKLPRLGRKRRRISYKHHDPSAYLLIGFGVTVVFFYRVCHSELLIHVRERRYRKLERVHYALAVFWDRLNEHAVLQRLEHAQARIVIV